MIRQRIIDIIFLGSFLVPFDARVPITEADRLDYQIGVYCINELGGFFETTKIAKQFGLHPTKVVELAARWDKLNWLGPSGNAKRGRVTDVLRDKIARVSVTVE